MRPAVVILAVMAAMAPGYNADPRYFTNVRDVTISSPQKQNYIVVDQEIWSRSKPDLTDLRLYDGGNQIPFVLREKRASKSTEDREAKVLNLGRTGTTTQFDLDMAGMPEYDHIRLQLTAQNFVATAKIEGKASLDDRSGVSVGSGTLYDFSRENLGSSTVLKIPTSTWPYLHVEVNPGFEPAQITGAFVSDWRDEQAAWVTAGSCGTAQSSQPKQTALTCQIFGAMPVDRIAFEIPANQVNFRRTVIVKDDHGIEVARNAISRVRMSRSGQTAVSETLSVDVPSAMSTDLGIVVENEDNAALEITSVQPLSIERRIYFDAQGKNSLKLYYGDAKLGQARYDYATFFHEDADAAQAALGPSHANPDYGPRPDDRPWSEQHKAVLWAAMLIAIAALGLVAIRGMTARPPEGQD